MVRVHDGINLMESKLHLIRNGAVVWYVAPDDPREAIIGPGGVVWQLDEWCIKHNGNLYSIAMMKQQGYRFFVQTTEPATLMEFTAMDRSCETIRHLLSSVAISNLFTMSAAGKKDARQELPVQHCIPSEAVRRCRALLAFEEQLEEIKVLGFKITVDPEVIEISSVKDIVLHACLEPDLDEIIDANCDKIYVATGTMLACGAVDLPHHAEVCQANNNKFPGGVATTNEAGKYIKPDGWKGPDHKAVREKHAVNLRAWGATLVDVSARILDKKA